MIALLTWWVGPAISLAGTAVAEPHTGVEFPTTLERQGTSMVLTGVDRRRVMGRNAYAIAHYVAPDHARQMESWDLDQRIDYLERCAGPKAIVMVGTYRKVPARGIRWSWKQHFERLGLSPHTDFIAAFQSPFREGERLYFHAVDGESLEVFHDTRRLGLWRDPSLVRAFWAMCLGPESEVEERTNLVSRAIPQAERRAERGEFPLTKPESQSPGKDGHHDDYASARP
jgi:hypothetical protein